MDRKAIIILVTSVALLAAWFLLVPKLLPPSPTPTGPELGTTSTNPAEAPLTVQTTTSTAPGRIEAPVNPAASSLAGPLPPVSGPEQLERLETPSAVYTFTSHGGGLKSVELKKYVENVGYGFQKADAARMQLNARTDVPALVLRGGAALLGDGEFKLLKTASNSVWAEKILSNNLAVVKEFKPGSNYLLQASLRIENRSPAAVKVPEHSWSAGAGSSANPQDDPNTLGGLWHNGIKEEMVSPAWFANSKFCMAGTPRTEYLAGASNVFWVAVFNQFFAMALLPGSNQVASQVLVRRLDLPMLPAVHGKTAPPYGYEASLLYPAALLSPGQALERHFTLYAGPKEYKTLARLGQNLDVVMGYTGFFGWFAKALLLSMNGLYVLVPNYGLVIILITLIIKLLFWPLTQASTRSMKRMQTLQPQMKAIQEKYKDDPTKMNKKLMEFMKENKVSPMGGCLPMMLQIPVFIGFYQMIRSAIELRGVPFLWATDLSRPDTIGFVPGLDFPINPLPLIMGATMLWQARTTPPTPGVDPMQQKIMKYMPMIFMVFLYNFSAGLTLYWTVQNLLTIAQMKLTKTKTGQPGGAPASLPLKKKRQA